jgi:hypothetical protein
MLEELKYTFDFIIIRFKELNSEKNINYPEL